MKNTSQKMKRWITTIKAISPINEEIELYGGPNIPGINIKDAEEYCENNGLGYCHIEGELG